MQDSLQDQEDEAAHDRRQVHQRKPERVGRRVAEGNRGRGPEDEGGHDLRADREQDRRPRPGRAHELAREEDQEVPQQHRRNQEGVPIPVDRCVHEHLGVRVHVHLIPP